MKSILKYTPKILFYDIETTPMKAWIWRLGDQVVRHDQLDEKFDSYDVICVTYCWNDGKPAQVLHWDYAKQDSKPMLAKLDEFIKLADVVIGKNSDRFDNKHLNFQRMMHRNEPMPQWAQYTDDLEKQFRKHFGQAIPSHSLDYISKKLGIGGKIKMELQDWIHIVNKTSKVAFNKMLKYGKKDVEDTRAIWMFAERYIEPKYSQVSLSKQMVCSVCGSNRIHKRGTREVDNSIYQMWYCLGHGGYSERTAILNLRKKDQVE